MLGRPTKFKEEYCEQARKLCLLGHTDADLAIFFEVNEDTIHEWKKVHLNFSESLRAGKTIADANVANALYKRAIGYSYEETTYEKIDIKVDGLSEDEEEDIKQEVYKKKVVEKDLAPDTGAATMWLKNRQPTIWRDKKEIDANIKGQMEIANAKITFE